MDIIQKLKKGHLSSSKEETHAIAAELAATLPKDCTIAFHGDLGAGKTTFIQGLAKAWEIKEPITSPTYNLFITYSGSRNLVHLDAYRLDSEEDLEAIMIDDFLVSPYCLAIEWPSKIESYIPEDAWHLHMSIEGTQHKIILKN